MRTTDERLFGLREPQDGQLLEVDMMATPLGLPRRIWLRVFDCDGACIWGEEGWGGGGLGQFCTQGVFLTGILTQISLTLTYIYDHFQKS